MMNEKGHGAPTIITQDLLTDSTQLSTPSDFLLYWYTQAVNNTNLYNRLKTLFTVSTLDNLYLFIHPGTGHLVLDCKGRRRVKGIMIELYPITWLVGLIDVQVKNDVKCNVDMACNRIYQAAVKKIGYVV
jgi:hypothetical protein